MLIKVTATSVRSSISTIYFSKPETILVNVYKIITVIPSKDGNTEIHLDETGRNILYVTETPEQIYEKTLGTIANCN